MHHRWLKDVPKDLREEVTKRFKESELTLKRLEKMIQADLDASLRATSNPNLYDCPNWERRMAHQLGEQEALRAILNYLRN